MSDAEQVRLAGKQFNRFSRFQLLELGFTHRAIEHRLASGRIVRRESGVYAIAPVLDDVWGRWMEATLTAPNTLLSHEHATVAWGFWSDARAPVTVTRPGSGGPRLHGGTLVRWSSTLLDERTSLRGIPITSPARTLLDLAPRTTERGLARAVREAVRLERVTLGGLGDALGRYWGRRGVRRLALTVARYAGLPLERARSGAEIRAMEILRDADRRLPRLNMKVAGEEADLSWKSSRLIVEIDGAPFHRDVGEDARKERAWAGAGWAVRRLPADAVYDDPGALLRLVPANV